MTPEKSWVRIPAREFLFSTFFQVYKLFFNIMIYRNNFN